MKHKHWYWYWGRWWRVSVKFADRIYYRDGNGDRLKRTINTNPNWGVKHYYKKVNDGEWIKK